MNEDLIARYVELFFDEQEGQSPTQHQVTNKAVDERSRVIDAMLKGEWLTAVSRCRADPRFNKV